uniref:Uncharacterized protein n=1 Tax=Rhizophora mucronata TaxID=61149 RepID=A0A2P2QKW2_RHIMU
MIWACTVYESWMCKCGTLVGFKQ